MPLKMELYIYVYIYINRDVYCIPGESKTPYFRRLHIPDKVYKWLFLLTILKIQWRVLFSESGQ